MGGTPSEVWVQGTPSQVWMGGTPHHDWMGYPPIQTWDGVPPDLRWGTPQKWDGVPQLSRPGMGYPPRPEMGHPPPAWRALATRRTVCLLRSRRRTFLFIECERADVDVYVNACTEDTKTLIQIRDGLNNILYQWLGQRHARSSGLSV